MAAYPRDVAILADEAIAHYRANECTLRDVIAEAIIRDRRATEDTARRRPLRSVLPVTKRGRQLLEFIHEYMCREGITPSFEEMAAGMGIKSKSGIHRIITSLEARGLIERTYHKARALSVTDRALQ